MATGRSAGDACPAEKTGKEGGGRREWVLASASPRRREILARLGLRFSIDPSGMTEPPRDPAESPAAYAVRVARLKAREVGARHPGALVLAADTIVVLDDDILGKPEGRSGARAMLGRLGGRWHEVLSGISLLDTARGAPHSTCGRARVHFRALSREEVEWYLDTGEYRDKAGAYGIQGYAALFIDRIEGCYFNIVGFPVAAFEALCREAEVDLRSHLATGQADPPTPSPAFRAAV